MKKSRLDLNVLKMKFFLFGLNGKSKVIKLVVRAGGWLSGHVVGWVDGLVDVKVVLWIAYSDQKLCL
jgi:hypothetical protein